MAEFTPINTQEEFEAAIRDRINRINDKYADYDALKEKAGKYDSSESEFKKAIEEANGKLAESKKAIEEKDKQLKAYAVSAVKTNVALQVGLPYEIAERLSGETEEDIRKDAEKLATMFRSKQTPVPPLKTPETPPEDGVRSAFAKMNPRLKF